MVKIVYEKMTTWAIVHREWGLMSWTLKGTRSDAIRAFVDRDGNTWKRRYREGYRAKRVKVSWEENQ